MADKTVTVRPSGGDYTTLAAAITGEVTANANLVTMAGILTISIEGDWSGGADTTAVNVTGFTTNASYYVNIVTDTANKAGTSWSASKYILSKTYSSVFTLTNAYTRATGLQIYNTNGYDAVILAGTGTVVDGCFVKSRTNTRASLYLSGNGSIAINTIVVSGASTGYAIYAVVNNEKIYNCVALACAGIGIAIANSLTGVNVTNCYSGGNTGDDYSGTAGTLTTCLSEDGTRSTSTAAFSTSSGAYFTNVTADSENLAIGASSTLIGAGTDLRADATWPFDYDIMGTTRGATWDVGAFEYVPPAGGISIPTVIHHMMMQGVL